METLNRFWTQFGTPRNRKVAYIILSLVALAAASGAPGAGSGVPGSGGVGPDSFTFLLGF